MKVPSQALLYGGAIDRNAAISCHRRGRCTRRFCPRDRRPYCVTGKPTTLCQSGYYPRGQGDDVGPARNGHASWLTKTWVEWRAARIGRAGAGYVDSRRSEATSGRTSRGRANFGGWSPSRRNSDQTQAVLVVAGYGGGGAGVRWTAPALRKFEEWNGYTAPR